MHMPHISLSPATVFAQTSSMHMTQKIIHDLVDFRGKKRNLRTDDSKAEKKEGHEFNNGFCGAPSTPVVPESGNAK